MTERRSVYADPDEYIEKLPVDGFGEIAGLVRGNPFTRNIEVESVTGTSFSVPTERQVIVAVMTDADGNYYCEPYDPEMHGEEIELRSISIDEFTSNLDFFNAQESFTQVRKAGSSKPTFNMDDVWRSRGGDPSFKLPKQIYSKNKLR